MGSTSVAMFLVAMSPLSQRHWKHTNPLPYTTITFGYIVLYFSWGIMHRGLVAVLAEALVVIWPVVSGLEMCLTLLERKKDKKPKVLDKLDAEEKQS